MSRNLFAQSALAEIPKILTLTDRNPHSPTYGCCDRNFWQYKIIDFPSGMSQEFALPLALAYCLDLPKNPFHQQSAIKDWTEAIIHYAAKSAHKDGACDDYFPFERASGAAAFSLYAFLESYQLLNLQDKKLLAFFETRATWLANHRESGQLANHEALIVLCLHLLGELLQTTQWEAQKSERLARLLSWQSDEGWFQEYGGFDPGYHTLTISCLARLHSLQPRDDLKKILIQAVDLAAQFVHPDGSFGGEYGSRNTYNFFPHGFELVGQWYPEALSVNDAFLKGLEQGKQPCYADDHIVGHHVWNYWLAWKDFVSDRPLPQPRPTERFWLKQAGILVDRRQETELYIALNKGGVFKLFRAGELVVSDTQISAQIQQGQKHKNAVGHLLGNYDFEIDENRIVVRGHLGWAKQTQMTPLKLLVLRFVNLTLGRFSPNLVRSLLQKVLITGKQQAPVQFLRQLDWHDGQWHVTDELKAETWDTVETIGISGHQTSIYVVVSRVFQESQLQPWIDLTNRIKRLNPGQVLTIERTY
ncbi:hypothetical protein PN498_00755 [Oscillatoria sp. CS-180]|uniref:hypothetical protein n=1 Tax=Oscillatoria sp. CS-180 TaxID=3021720 RepID=UPI00232AD89A|nr:hypothetical protein [Oscillatoria sp. CS-180]MDB9524502.1 hypothetical protein [Oscillatoria sp. CS-180]